VDEGECVDPNEDNQITIVVNPTSNRQSTKGISTYYMFNLFIRYGYIPP